MPANPQKQLGKYQLTDVLGEGAMGVVYRAFDPVLNRYLAIKVMSDVIAGDATLRDRFLREARAAGSLQHPNVITVYDFGEVESHLFIAMEYVEGVDLAELIERRDHMPIVNKIDIIIDTLNGLAYAHSRGVVHRDIKPANIRVSTDGQAKIMDFGIARLQSSEMTRSGELLGTPQYMAPEQVTGGEITPAADIFAIGAVLYELLTYTKAFPGDTLHVVLYNIASSHPPAVRSIVSSVPASVEAIISKALSKDPAERYPNAPAMVKALRIARQDLAERGARPKVKVRSSTKTLTAMDIRERRPLWQRAGAVGGLVLVVAVATGLWLVPWRSGARTGPDAAADAKTAPSTQTTLAPTAPPPASPSATRPSATSKEGGTRLKAPPATSGSGRADPPSKQPERSAAAVTTRDTASPARAASPPTTVAAAPAPVSTAPVTPPGTTQPAPTASAPATPPPRSAESTSKATADPRPDIERTVGLYARAIESANIPEIRRVYAGLTAQQQQQWEGFFRAVKNFKAHLTIDRLAVDGATADAGIGAVYDYENTTTGQSEHRTLRLQATLNRDAGGWRIATIK